MVPNRRQPPRQQHGLNVTAANRILEHKIIDNDLLDWLLLSSPFDREAKQGLLSVLWQESEMSSSVKVEQNEAVLSGLPANAPDFFSRLLEACL